MVMSEKIMNNKRIKKILLAAVLAFALMMPSLGVFAAGYKYKITDPRYNTSVQYAIPQTSYSDDVDIENPINKKKQNTQLLIILLMIVVPGILIVSTIKNIEPKSQYRKSLIPEDFKESVKSVLMTFVNLAVALAKKIAELFKATAGEALQPKMQYHTSSKIHTSAAQKVKNEIEKNTDDIKDEDVKTEQVQEQENVVVSKNVQNYAKPNIVSKIQEKQDNEKAEFSINEYLSSPIQKKHNPILLSSSKLTRNKGLCLVQYKNKVSLIGYINKKVFMLAQFNSLSTNEIRSRLAENEGDNERYIVKLGNYKALLEVSDNNMELLLEL